MSKSFSVWKRFEPSAEAGVHVALPLDDLALVPVMNGGPALFHPQPVLAKDSFFGIVEGMRFGSTFHELDRTEFNPLRGADSPPTTLLSSRDAAEGESFGEHLLGRMGNFSLSRNGQKLGGTVNPARDTPEGVQLAWQLRSFIRGLRMPHESDDTRAGLRWVPELRRQRWKPNDCIPILLVNDAGSPLFDPLGFVRVPLQLEARFGNVIRHPQGFSPPPDVRT